MGQQLNTKIARSGSVKRQGGESKSVPAERRDASERKRRTRNEKTHPARQQGGLLHKVTVP